MTGQHDTDIPAPLIGNYSNIVYMLDQTTTDIRFNDKTAFSANPRWQALFNGAIESVSEGSFDVPIPPGQVASLCFMVILPLIIGVFSLIYMWPKREVCPPVLSYVRMPPTILVGVVGQGCRQLRRRWTKKSINIVNVSGAEDEEQMQGWVDEPTYHWITGDAVDEARGELEVLLQDQQEALKDITDLYKRGDRRDTDIDIIDTDTDNEGLVPVLPPPVPERNSRARRKATKATLAKALQKAHTAVLLDRSLDTESADLDSALENYIDTCALLQQVIDQTTAVDEVKKLEMIKLTYTT
ncbi:hypothetical protein LTS12_029303, partial [Elasticomyces elasticus]